MAASSRPPYQPVLRDQTCWMQPLTTVKRQAAASYQMKPGDKGTCVFDSDESKPYVWDGSSWIELATAAALSNLNYCASRSLAKASVLLTDGRMYYVDASPSGFLPGWFLYDSSSAETADESDVLDPTTLPGKLIRKA